MSEEAERLVQILSVFNAEENGDNKVKGYIEYNGYRMANSSGDNNDWTSEFWAKFCKICQFYRTRWFFPDSLKKKSTVVYNKIQYNLKIRLKVKDKYFHLLLMTHCLCSNN